MAENISPDQSLLAVTAIKLAPFGHAHIDSVFRTMSEVLVPTNGWLVVLRSEKVPRIVTYKIETSKTEKSRRPFDIVSILELRNSDLRDYITRGRQTTSKQKVQVQKQLSKRKEKHSLPDVTSCVFHG